jgi:hypothetical protein
MSIYQEILRDTVHDATFESAEARNCRIMLENMCRVVSVCLPIFDLAMRSLSESTVGIYGFAR